MANCRHHRSIGDQGCSPQGLGKLRSEVRGGTPPNTPFRVSPILLTTPPRPPHRNSHPREAEQRPTGTRGRSGWSPMS